MIFTKFKVRLGNCGCLGPIPFLSGCFIMGHLANFGVDFRNGLFSPIWWVIFFSIISIDDKSL